jgi:hypothetical protein
VARMCSTATVGRLRFKGIVNAQILGLHFCVVNAIEIQIL